MTPDLTTYWEGAGEQLEDNKWNEKLKTKTTQSLPYSAEIRESN